MDATHSLVRYRAYSAFAAERHMRHPISNRAASVAEIEVIVADVSSRVGEAGGMHRSHDVAYWIETTTKRGPRIRSIALARLGELGILESASEGAVRLTARVSRSRCYTGPDGQSAEDVRLRIMSQLFSDDIPNPRDAVIIALAEAAGAIDGILSESERSQAQERIDRFRQLDLIGRAVTAALSDAAEQDVPVTPIAKTVPKAPGLPLIGNALAMSRDLHGFLVEQHRNLGPDLPCPRPRSQSGRPGRRGGEPVHEEGRPVPAHAGIVDRLQPRGRCRPYRAQHEWSRASEDARGNWLRLLTVGRGMPNRGGPAGPAQ